VGGGCGATRQYNSGLEPLGRCPARSILERGFRADDVGARAGVQDTGKFAEPSRHASIRGDLKTQGGVEGRHSLDGYRDLGCHVRVQQNEDGGRTRCGRVGGCVGGGGLRVRGGGAQKGITRKNVTEKGNST